ncbi:MAG: septation protein SepH, partial [Acidimicrobiales bacterium]
MQKLHLVGFTTDQKGLILSARRSARAGGFHLPLDDALAEAVEELRARQDEADVEDAEDAEAVRVPRVESALPVREIQARLRQGRSVAEVARAAGVEPAWVERFAPPVFAEQAQVVAKVQAMALRRPRLGPSSHSIGDAVRRNLAERGATSSPEEFASGWTTRQLADGRWSVRFSFRHRNQDQTLRFDLDETTGSVTSATQLSGQLGYVAPPASVVDPASRTRSPRQGREDQRSAKRATVTTGFRPDEPSSKPTSRPAKERERATQALRRAASRGAADAERAAARKGKEKEAAARRAEREAKVAELRRRRERQAAEKAKAAAARAKAVAAERAAAARDRRKSERQAAAQAKRAEATLFAAERARAAAQEITRKAAAREAAADERAATRRAAVKKAAVKKAAATVKHATTTKVASAKKAATTSVATTEAVRVEPATPTRAPAHMASEGPAARRRAAGDLPVTSIPPARPAP